MHIDNIKNLLTKANVSEAIANSICEAMEQYKVNVDSQAQNTIKEKVKAVKAVVLEEVATYKNDLAKKVQLFCESKNQTIEQQLTRRSAAGETEAQNRLKQVTALLEGVELDGKPNSEISAKYADAQAKIDLMAQKAKVQDAALKRSIRVSESVLARNKQLIVECQNLRKGTVLVSEGKKTAPAPVATPEKMLVVAPKTKAQPAPAKKAITEGVAPANINSLITQIADNM